MLGWTRLTFLSQILAYFWDLDARCRWGATDTERTILERKNGHHYIGCIRKLGSHGGVLHLGPREGVSIGVWKKIKEDTVLLVGTPTEHKDRPVHGRRRSSLGREKGLAPVRAKMPNATLIKEIKPGVCRIVYVNQTDAGGRVPVAVMNRALLRNLALTHKVKEHFLSRRGLEEWDEEYGEAVGEVLVTKTDAEKHQKKGQTGVEARVEAMMVAHKGLKELRQKHEWIEVLLKKVVANKLRPAGDSKVKLCNMSEKEASVVGGALASCIAANLTAHAAVDEWILRYPAMRELDREYVRE
jgi:hypothetical protein